MIITVIPLIVENLESTEKNREAYTQISPKFTTQTQFICGVFFRLLAKTFFSWRILELT